MYVSTIKSCNKKQIGSWEKRSGNNSNTTVSPMECIKSDTCLGDKISSDGSNTENIRNRVSKGNGIIAKIKSILKSDSLRKHLF